LAFIWGPFSLVSGARCCRHSGEPECPIRRACNTNAPTVSCFAQPDVYKCSYSTGFLAVSPAPHVGWPLCRVHLAVPSLSQSTTPRPALHPTSPEPQPQATLLKSLHQCSGSPHRQAESGLAQSAGRGDVVGLDGRPATVVPTLMGILQMTACRHSNDQSCGAARELMPRAPDLPRPRSRASRTAAHRHEIRALAEGDS
jgi:hypothetical protein